MYNAQKCITHRLTLGGDIIVLTFLLQIELDNAVLHLVDKSLNFRNRLHQLLYFIEETLECLLRVDLS